MRYLIGIDEAGRAPLAGPVAVGAAMVKSGFDWSLVGGVRDSKLMSKPARERYFRLMQQMQREGILKFSVAFAPHSMIDEKGITMAVQFAIERALQMLRADPSRSNVFLDGLLSAPDEFKNQQTIVGGDDVLPIISLAAIAAKVTRDRLMTRFAKKFPSYGFEQHKGYGTRSHREAIRRFGLCEIHRMTYSQKFAVR
ncbi:ribonuclease HII [Candidatus Kaiserbacteria bacterium]|nr:ribonuclease HII [Candidatus Kaiserbacteria bacterium]